MYAACKMQTSVAVQEKPQSKITQINPTIITVEKATVRLKSFSSVAVKTTKTKLPIPAATTGIETAIPKLKSENTPAMTSVQECNKLDTGVGPSIASGSQRKFRTITDFKVRQINNVVKIELVVTAVPSAKIDNAIRRKTSPSRLKPMAE